MGCAPSAECQALPMNMKFGNQGFRSQIASPSAAPQVKCNWIPPWRIAAHCQSAMLRIDSGVVQVVWGFEWVLDVRRHGWYRHSIICGRISCELQLSFPNNDSEPEAFRFALLPKHTYFTGGIVTLQIVVVWCAAASLWKPYFRRDDWRIKAGS